MDKLEAMGGDESIKIRMKALKDCGGKSGLFTILKCKECGMSNNSSELLGIRNLYGANTYPEPEVVTWFQMFIDSFDDTTLKILIGSAIVSLAIGIYENPAHGWIEGSAILFAVNVVAVVTATNNFNKESQFRKLNAVSKDVKVQCLRDGKPMEIDVKDLVVGDIVVVSSGLRVPADGVLISGTDVVCDESSLTGESEESTKTALGDDTAAVADNDDDDVFLLSGTNVQSGHGHMLVTAVGEKSRWGRTKAKLATPSEDTPLQQKLETLANQIGYFGMAVAGATFIAMLAVWYYSPRKEDWAKSLMECVLNAFIMAVTIVVVAVPEGLPLAVTLSLAFSTHKMMKDNNLIRVLAACETMGNATNICSDKTGTLTQNKMTVVRSCIGGELFSGDDDMHSVTEAVQRDICHGVAVNSTAVLMTDSTGEHVTVCGNKTEGALLVKTESFGADYVTLRSQLYDARRGDRMFTFTSDRKCMSVLLCDQGASMRGLLLRSPTCPIAPAVTLSNDGPLRPAGTSRQQQQQATLFSKGAAEVMLRLCTHYVDCSGSVHALDQTARNLFEGVIDSMAKESLRTIALTHRAITELPLADNMRPCDLECDLVLDVIYGIKDPLRPEVTEAVRACQQAGITVRMVTGDNIETAKAIARECGILTEGGLAMDGPEFRRMRPDQLDAVLPILQVLARSSPSDKHTLVTRLNGHALPATQEQWEKDHPGCSWLNDRDDLLPGYRQEWDLAHAGGGEVVGVTGDGTNDGPALKAADVGLSMGLSGTDVAKEASDIVILDDNFASIVKAVMWGRAVFDNIRKFLQFQLTVNAVALTLTFLSAVFGQAPPLNAVMMLWVNMIMDTMGALALGTEPPAPSALLARKPYKRNASLITNRMIRNILVQFAFQMALLWWLQWHGSEAFEVLPGSIEHSTVIFNVFVLCQVFNEVNARSIENEANVFHNLFQNHLFLGILLFTLVAQGLLVQFGGEFVHTAPLSQQQWLKSFLLAALSLTVGGLMRLIPVQNSLKDFAESSKLIAANSDNKSSRKPRNNDSSAMFSLSGLVWLVVVTAVPAVCCVMFSAEIEPLINHCTLLFSQLFESK